MIKYVFLDIDDTLLDFGKAEAAAIKKTFDRIGVPSSPEVIALYSRINDEHWAMLERGELTREQVLVKRFDVLFAELGIKNVPSEMAQASYEYLLGIGHYFVDGAPELLQALKDKYELYIVSNGTASVQDSRLESAGIAPYFKDIFISERLGADKPTKKFFDIVFSRIEGFERDLPRHFARHLYYAENWEDAEGFRPYVYLDVSDGFALWEKAIEHHWFAVHSTSFPYKEYYSHLKRPVSYTHLTLPTT